MITPSEDQEITKIRKTKITEILQRAQTQTKSAENFSDKPIVLTDNTFSSELPKHKLIIVDFWAPWCGPCRMVGPFIEQLATEYAGKVTFGKINVDDNPMVASSFGVQSIPTLMIFKNGEAVDTIVGACPKSHIESKFKQYIERK